MMRSETRVLVTMALESAANTVANHSNMAKSDAEALVYDVARELLVIRKVCKPRKRTFWDRNKARARRDAGLE